MNILKRDRRRSRVRKARLENLDDRIVLSTVQPAMAAAAEVATVHASAVSAAQSEGTATAESKIEIRHENRIARIEERRELRIERRDARLARLAELKSAAHHFSPAVVVETPAALAAAMASATAKRAQAARGSSRGNGSSSSGTSTLPTLPTSITQPLTPVSTTPGTGSGTSSGSGSTTNTPLPANVSTLLDTVYDEFQNGDLPTTAQPGQVEIQGTNVGIEIRSSSPSNFSATIAAAESLGLQVTTVSDAFDIVVGFLPIAQLPAIAQLSGSPSITPVLYPEM
jgi:hypothetical protein